LRCSSPGGSAPPPPDHQIQPENHAGCANDGIIIAQLIPMIFIIDLAGLVVSTVINRRVELLAGLILTLIGFPVYRYWNRQKSDEPESVNRAS
jgi:hypothetical protein